MQDMNARAVGALIALSFVASLAIAGPDWIEDGDAGSTVLGAQDTTQAGILNTIVGTLGGNDREDVYGLIIEDSDDISSPVTFGLLPGADPTFNPALWLFDSAGFGVLGNDDDPILGGPSARLIAPSTDGVTLHLPPGVYYLAITESGNVPLSFRTDDSSGFFEEIFAFSSTTEVSGPDGAGADNPLAAWSGGAGTDGNYGIVISPAPTSVAAFAIAGIGLTRRRREA